ncbi:MAG: FAD-binding oxidoreductase [Bryobacteraceae bacterium]
MDSLAAPLTEWSRLLGQEFVDVRQQSRTEAETATFATHQKVVGVIRPGTKEQLRECVRVANEFRIPIYPVSSGKNWGYGSRVPPADQSVIVDLSRLNRILDFREDLAYVTVEPGVTQRQLYRFLEERNSRLWMDATGSSPDCSLIGNVMERGFGHTPLGDHFAHVCGLEVLLPSGEFIETGFASFPNSRSAETSRWGLGPSFDGLFSQSNLGIVTRMTVWLMPAPEAFEAFFFRAEDPAALGNLINSLRDLRMRDVLRSAAHIGNDYKVLAGLQQYPWTESGGQTPLGRATMAQFRQKLGFGAWNVSGGLYGTPSQVREAKSSIRRALGSHKGKLKFLKPSTLAFAKRFAGAFKLISGWDLSRTVELVEPVLGLMQGVPTNQPMHSAYWRKKMAVPADPNPDRDRCGLLWYAPIAPTDGEAVAELTSLSSEILLRHGFEPQISLTLLTPRMTCCIVSISFDRDVPGEDERAKACYDEVSERCMASGFYPYRSGIQGNFQAHQSQNYRSFAQRLKVALDPNGILAPGRYEVRPCPADDRIEAPVESSQ